MTTVPDPVINPFALPETGKPGAKKLLRLLAVGGVAVVLLQETISSFPLQPRQESGFIVLVVAVIAVLLVLFRGLPGAWQKLQRYPDLLVPLGVLTLAEAVIAWLVLIPAVSAILSPSKQLQFAGLSLSLSIGFVFSIVLNVAYSAWTTLLIRNIVLEERGDPVTSFAGCWRWFLRVLGLEFIGWGVLFAGLAACIALAPLGLPLAFIAMAIGALVWNLATAALLPQALDDRLRFWDALKTGMRHSWSRKGLWWKVVVLHMLLLGFFTYVSVSYSESTPRGYNRQDTTNWAVNAFWTGGYENDCHWYSALMKAYKSPKVQVISTALGLVFGVLAIGVKLTVAERLWPRQTRFAPEGVRDAPDPPEDWQERYTPPDRWQ